MYHARTLGGGWSETPAGPASEAVSHTQYNPAGLFPGAVLDTEPRWSLDEYHRSKAPDTFYLPTPPNEYYRPDSIDTYERPFKRKRISASSGHIHVFTDHRQHDHAPTACFSSSSGLFTPPPSDQLALHTHPTTLQVGQPPGTRRYTYGEPSSYKSLPSATYPLANNGESNPLAAVDRHGFNFCNPPDEELCFGMIGPVAFDISRIPSNAILLGRDYVLDNVRLNSELGTLSVECGPIGQLSKHLAKVIGVLEEQGVSLQLRCTVAGNDGQRSRRKRETINSKFSATFCATLYGSQHLFAEIGSFLEDCDICLQDPKAACDRNVLYRNPHKYSGSDEIALMTLNIDEKCHDGEMSANGNFHCPLDDLSFQGNLPEADTPPALSTELFGHQRQALYFMSVREQAWCYGDALKDIWKSIYVAGRSMYWNTVNDDIQMDPPKMFRGGLLLDDMGLGKSLTIIALIASDLANSAGGLQRDALGLSTHNPRCTLVIVPPPLLGTWEEQITKHTHSTMFRWYKHHGNCRLSQLSHLALYDLVLTTYETVSAEFKGPRSANSILFQAHWHRVILDEAHEIRDPRTQSAKALCALKAGRRWAVTGTPIQNHLSDFKALLQYLRAFPYDDPFVFDRDISSVWKYDAITAIRRLKHIITSLGLRRPRRAVDLPPRSHSDVFLDFSRCERELYEPLESKVITHLGRLGDAPEQRSSSNPLQALNALRLVCNFGTLSDAKHLQVFDRQWSWGAAKAQQLFDGLLTAGHTFCTRCSKDVLLVPASIDALVKMTAVDLPARQPLVSECAKLLCSNCHHSEPVIALLSGWCGHSPACQSQSVTPSYSSFDVKPTALSELTLPDFPTKIRALVSDLQLFPGSKSVVFSMWRTTLDLCAAAFTLVNIPFVRFDGNVSESGRISALKGFRDDPTIKVILFTISCGAVGLDLTAADRSYLMEPQWNPTVEDQAFARIHRLGQEKPVTTIRFIMSASYEDHVVEVQKQKKDFADLLLSGKKPMGGGAFEVVRRLVAKR